ncbi:DUF2182 domain-containing protein [Mameliella sediminis]|uniref:DUF2182 domain-containing protein n=1 Tax=Mameliella sediminis TaxID=2836866 RepID=UPI001C45EBD8|nr:DUF2182 domain-containing protein [Mameliella sediminis]MBV7392739.1 DUF2182 domain-containing protein [Mameliella sediminis]
MMARIWQDIFWLGLFALVLAAWAALYAMALGSGLDVLGRPGLGAEALLALCSGPSAGFAGAAVVWAMWAGMGVAMMLPTFVPVLTTHQKIATRMADAMASRLGLVAGYMGIWLGFSLLAAAAQIALSRAGLLDDFGAARGSAVQGGLLILAGLWQFTAFKSRCQSVCLTPMAYFMGRFRPGAGGGLWMGAELGLACVGCCWAIMALGFVGGVMNLAWMGLATLFMVLEKLPAAGALVRRPAGGVLIVSGLALWAGTML